MRDSAAKPTLGYVVAVGLMRLVTSGLTRWTVAGLENVPKNGPIIIAANHFGFLDPPLLAASFHRPITLLAKADFWCSQPSRLFCEAMGVLPIKRGEPDRRGLERAAAVLRDGGAVAFF